MTCKEEYRSLCFEEYQCTARFSLRCCPIKSYRQRKGEKQRKKTFEKKRAGNTAKKRTDCGSPPHWLIKRPPIECLQKKAVILASVSKYLLVFLFCFCFFVCGGTLIFTPRYDSICDSPFLNVFVVHTLEGFLEECLVVTTLKDKDVLTMTFLFV